MDTAVDHVPNHPRPGFGRGVPRHFGPLLWVASATLALHIWSLWDGLFLDDHWHRLQMQTRGWSLDDLLESTTIEPKRFVEHWWQDREVRWQYIRPVSFGLMKLVHQATGGAVAAQHAVSIGLHAASAVMVYGLCFLLTRSRLWSAIGGMLFGAYSHATITVAWLAAQNAVLQTGLSLAALLLYVRSSRLELFPYGASAFNRSSDGEGTGRATRVRPELCDGVRIFSLVACVAAWVLALLARENAIVLPVVFAAMDLAFAGKRHARARLPVYLLFALIAAAFMFWRLVLWYQPMPDVYVRRWDGPQYLPWVAAKFLHYVCSSIWLSPMTVGPSGRYNPWIETPGDCALMLAIVGFMGAGYWMAARNARGWWIWPLWIVLALLPVVPVMATPHSGYMPAVGFAVGMVLPAALRRTLVPVAIGRWCHLVAIWFLVATHLYFPIYRALWKSFVSAERCAVQQIAAFPPPNEAKDVFFINLPFVNIYVQPSLREALSPAGGDLRCHVLCYSSDVLRAADPIEIEQLDSHRFTVRTPGRPWFSGYLGRFLSDALRSEGRLSPGDRVASELFDVEVASADAMGIREFVFTFRQPLQNPRFAFYASFPDCPAARVLFSGPGTVIRPSPHEAAFAREHLARLESERDMLYTIRSVASRITCTDLYLTGPPYPGPR